MGDGFCLWDQHGIWMVAMSKIRSVDYIITAKHYAEREGVESVKERILKMRADLHKKQGVVIQIENIDKPLGAAVKARIWQGQWIADCECGGAEFVAPEEPIFFCFGCANRQNGHRPRPVEFLPEVEREEIEQLILERPVNDLAGLTDLERAGMAQPILYVEVVEENMLQPSLIEHLAAMKETGKPAAKKVTKLLPLVRSWEPGETAADLRSQQEAVIRKWKEALKTGPKNGKAV